MQFFSEPGTNRSSNSFLKSSNQCDKALLLAEQGGKVTENSDKQVSRKHREK
jgi:hypothetical protein